jgi:hypothetical protein
VAHGGAISVGEAPEGGAIFTMEFQALAEARAEVKPPSREAYSGAQPLQGL